MERKIILPLTSIRGVAAIFVFFMHINQTYKGISFFEIFSEGYLGVDLFFLLSGFIISYTHPPVEISKLGFSGFYKKFIMARFARIYPLHFCTLVFILGLALCLPGFFTRYHSYFTLDTFIANLFLVQNWGFWNISWNTVSWSISAEWFMYLLFPFMLKFYSRVSGIFSLCSIATLILFIHYSIAYYFEWSHFGGMSLGGMIRVLFEFSLGVVAFHLTRNSSFINAKLGNLAGVILTTLTLAAVLFESLWFFFVPSAMLLIMYLGTADNVITKMYSSSFLVYLGNISFSLYMWHWIIIQIQNWMVAHYAINVDSNSIKLVLCSIIIVCSFLVAHFSFNFIEKPARKFIASRVV